MFLKIHNFLTNVQKATTRGWKLLTHIHDQQPDCDIMLRLNYPLRRGGSFNSTFLHRSFLNLTVKNYENRSNVTKVIVKVKRPTFWRHRVFVLKVPLNTGEPKQALPCPKAIHSVSNLWYTWLPKVTRVFLVTLAIRPENVMYIYIYISVNRWFSIMTGSYSEQLLKLVTWIILCINAENFVRIHPQIVELSCL